MKTFIMLGWRNLWRQKRRSLVVITSITLGVLMMMFALGLMNGIISQMLDNSISTKLGHVAIHKKGFFENMKLVTNFYPDQHILRPLEKVVLFGAEQQTVRHRRRILNRWQTDAFRTPGPSRRAAGGF